MRCTAVVTLGIVVLAWCGGLVGCHHSMESADRAQPTEKPSESARTETTSVHEQGSIWPLVAQSAIIVTGTLDVPVAEIRRALASKEHHYVKFQVQVDEVLKGHADRVVTVCHFTQPSGFGVSPAALMQAHGNKAILFLVETSEEWSGCKRYFAGHSPGALESVSPEVLEQVRKELSEQATTLRDFNQLFPPKDEPLYQDVKRLIDATTNKDTQEQAFSQLEGLGVKAVPAMIMLMDDRRPLGVSSISLENRAVNAWEGLRNYSPDVVADALDAILNQITGRSFGSIHNGGSEEERQRTINGWRIYLYHVKRDTGGSSTTATIPSPKYGDTSEDGYRLSRMARVQKRRRDEDQPS